LPELAGAEVSVGVSIGIDLGSSRVKLLALDEEGNCLGVTMASYATESRRPGYAEQNPERWWDALRLAMSEMLSRPNLRSADVVGLGLTGQMHSAVLLDEAGAPVRPALMWSDARADAEAREIEKRIPRAELVARTGNRANVSFTAPKIMWVAAHEPEVLAKTRWIVQPKDALRVRLTGEVASDVSDASATLLFDLQARSWATDVCEKLGIDAGLLPPVSESESVAGALREDAARALGLPAGIAVAVGGADAPAAGLGLGLARLEDARGTILISLGTGGQVLAPVSAPKVDPEGRLHGLCHVVPGRWCVMAAILSAAASLDWVVRLLRPDDPNGSRELLAAAAKVPAGSDGLIFLPYLRGERTPHFDPAARGAVVGLQIGHGPAELTRAVLEGVAYALSEGLDLMRGIGIEATAGVVAGGGVNRLWQQIVADVLNLPVALGATEHGSARGAALLGAVAGGVIPSTEQVVPPLPQDTRVMEPIPENVELYAEISATYRELYGRLPRQ
jgi:xylulokinase